jgi:hypothetical protein
MADHSGCKSQCAAPVRIIGTVPQQLLLPMRARDGGEPGVDAAVGRVALGASGLWQPQAEGAVAPGGFEGQPQARGTVAAFDGDRGHLGQATDQPARTGPSNLSVSVARFGGDRAGSSLVFGYHVCADGHGVHVSGGGDGLVESLCVGLAVEQHVGGGLLCGRLGGGAAEGTAGPADLPHRSRLAVHLADVYRRGGIGGRGREQGWSGAVDRQPVYRTAVAERQA